MTELWFILERYKYVTNLEYSIKIHTTSNIGLENSTNAQVRARIRQEFNLDTNTICIVIFQLND